MHEMDAKRKPARSPSWLKPGNQIQARHAIGPNGIIPEGATGLVQTVDHLGYVSVAWEDEEVRTRVENCASFFITRGIHFEHLAEKK